ncbi:hypothetical protein N6B72_04970 [Chryseobacterium soli]|uniref:hypothetical protein n=1 Tax=Chryseobacterium soli TaxID=445961 RepID=UPI002952C0C9|nr:hypothetical protein [Chryseobacterium soli]MDV7696269.1 hypothetical protein [Chryseobacterium soli]
MKINVNEYGKKYIDYKNELYFIEIDREDVKIFCNENEDELLILDKDNNLIRHVKAESGQLGGYFKIN